MTKWTKTLTTSLVGVIELDFLINDLSLHGQFNSTAEFLHSVDVLMEIRKVIRLAGKEFYCHHGLHNAQVTRNTSMPQAITEMPVEKRRAWMQWLTKTGPHWQDDRKHSTDHWLSDDNEPIFTDHSIGEAAFCTLHGKPCSVVSLSPSDWLRSPIHVAWHRNDADTQQVDVPNHWSINTLKPVLDRLPVAFDSWDSLEAHCRRSYENLTFSDVVMQLTGYPYVRCVGESINVLLGVLDRLTLGDNGNGNRTREFEILYDTYFTGGDPYFTDESTTNKREFKSQLTFKHHLDDAKAIFCPWHGKVNSPNNFPPVRIHFTWPITPNERLYVAYVGRKLTTR